MQIIFTEINKKMENAILIKNISEDELRQIIRQELVNVKLKPDENFKTRAEIAKKLRVSVVSLDKAVRDGRIKAVRLNGRILFRESDIKLEEVHFKGKK